jgi:4-aminobutyrate aminotransferase-like enzyme
MTHCLEQGRVVLMSCGTDGNVIRFMPPLVVTEDEITRALAAFDTALAATAPA